MRFSVVIPVYNKSAYIGETLQSVLNQSFDDFEIVVIDDESSDNSVEVIEAYHDNRIQLYKKKNGGVSAARNYGILKSNGEIICFLDADDIWKPDYLMRLSWLIEQYPEAGFFCGAYDIFYKEKNNIVKEKNLSFNESEDEIEIDYIKMSVLMFGSIALTSAVAIRKSVLERMDMWFDERFCIGEDNDLWTRVSLITKAVYNKKPLMLYRSASIDGLISSNYEYDKSVKYSNWYKLSGNKYLHKYASQMAYGSARTCYKKGKYYDTLLFLGEIRGMHYIFRRIVLWLLALFKKQLYK